MKNPLISVQGLTKRFSLNKRSLTAIKEVSFNIHPGETLGLVGESGCGKSTIAKSLIQIYQPDEGQIYFDGHPLSKNHKQIQMVFQDPASSLNPRMTAEEIIREPLSIHKLFARSERRQRALDLMKLVGLSSDQGGLYPHEFSGGQKQRISIARALAVEPRFLILDEPISALDVSIQAQIVALLKNLQERFNLTYLFISHDLAMVKYLSTRVAVMYLGEIVEIADAETLYNNPRHPYTRALLASIPIPDPLKEKERIKITLKGEIPSPLARPKGCPFASRCPLATAVCCEENPKMRGVTPTHTLACHNN